MADGIISKIQLPDNTIYDVVDNTSGYMTGMTILSYGGSTWQNFIDAYSSNKVVYCRASSNSNPASGSQTRLAFMAYVNNATTPTEVEFQYYRSVSTHTASQQGDQVYVYKLNKTNGWSVTIREASVKVVAGTGLGGTYSNGTMTLTGPTKVSDLTNDSGFLTSSSTLDASKLSGAIPSAVTATTQSASDNSTKIATTAYVTTAIANLPEPMLFKGSVGTGGTITSLPTATAANEGFTYKVITDLSSPVTAKVGDTVISNGSAWVVIPSGDEPSGTVTSVGLTNATNGGLTISDSPITSSGSITVGHSNVLTSAQTTQAVYPIKIDKNGHISGYGTAVTIPTKVSDLTNDSGFVTTDNKLEISSVSNGSYYPIVASNSTTAAIRQYDNTGFEYLVSKGTTSTRGYSRLTLGNSTSVNNAGNKEGIIRLYGQYTGYADISLYTYSTSGRTITIPDASGTLALTSDIPNVSGKIDTAGTGLSKSGTTLNHSNSITAQTTSGIYPIKIDAQGHITEYGSAVTIPALKNVFGKVKVGSTTIEADTTQDTLELAAGSNITLTPDATNDKVTIAATDTTYSDFTGAASNTAGTHGLVPAPASGENHKVLFGDADWDSLFLGAAVTAQSEQFNLTLCRGNYEDSYTQLSELPLPTVTTHLNGLMSVSDKTKLDGIASGAEVNVQSDWNQTTTTADDYIKNKPTSMTPSSHTHGNITNDGKLQTTDVTIASGDKLVVTDSSDSSKVARASVSFDGSTTTKALTQKGTFETFCNLSSSQALTNKTYNSYTLSDACAKGVVTSISDDSSNLPTVTAVKNYVLQNGIFYGTCTDTADKIEKTATVSGVTELKTGLTIAVKFTNSNTASNPQLQVNSLESVLIRRYGTTNPSTKTETSWNAGAVVTMTYDGSSWVMHDWLNTTYSSMSVAEYEAGTGTTARLITPARLKGAIQYWGGSGGSGTSTPTADTTAEFDSSAKMNSTDMTAAQVSTFVGNLNCLNEITDDMNSEEIENFVDDVTIPGAVVADYVIEENTSGIWTYRKWHSGKAECWGRAINCSIPANWSTTGVNIALPFIFKTMTNWQIQHQNYQINNCYGYPTTVTNTYDNINIQTNASDALSTAAFMILCQGTWK